MPLTIVDIETELVSRLSGFLTLTGKSTVIDNANPNPDLINAINYALRQSGYVIAVPPNATDADLLNIPSTAYDQIYDWAEFKTLTNLQGSMTLVDTTAGPFHEKKSQAYKPLKDRIDFLWQYLNDTYGLPSNLDSDVITLDIASHYDNPRRPL